MLFDICGRKNVGYVGKQMLVCVKPLYFGKCVKPNVEKWKIMCIKP